MGQIIARNQIINGGPIILVQVENEYSAFKNGLREDTKYEELLLAACFQSWNSSSLPPLMMRGLVCIYTRQTSEADMDFLGGTFTTTDIYGYDSYPQGFDCSHPNKWPSDGPPVWQYGTHEKDKPESLQRSIRISGWCI